MKNKNLLYLIIVLLVLVLIGSIIKLKIKPDSPQLNPELEQYRSSDIPVDCQLPEYESSVDSWKEHLSHHKETEYCLEYFKN